MGTWKEYIEFQNSKYTGRRVRYNGIETVIDHVDYNGAIHVKCVPRVLESPAARYGVYLPTIAVNISDIDFI